MIYIGKNINSKFIVGKAIDTPYYLPDVYAIKDGEPKRLYSVYRKSENLLNIKKDLLVRWENNATWNLEATGGDNYIDFNGTGHGYISINDNNSSCFNRVVIQDGKTYTLVVKNEFPNGIYVNYWVYTEDGLKVNVSPKVGGTGTTYIQPNTTSYVTFTADLAGKPITNSAFAVNGFYSGTTYTDARIYISINEGNSSECKPYLEKVHSIVPDGYQALEYIKSGSSNAYIDSGVMGSKTIKVDDYISYDALNNDALSGGDGVNTDTRFKWGLNGIARLYYGYRYNSESASVTIGEKYHYHIEDGNQYIESFGGSKLISSTYVAPDGYHPYPISLYAIRAYNNQSISSYQLDSRHYATRIYDGNTIIRDYIPVRTTKETTDYDGNTVAVGTLGLFDKVSGKMFVNKSTGTFTAGPEL